MTVTRDLSEDFKIHRFGRVYIREALGHADGKRTYPDFNYDVPESVSSKMGMNANQVMHLRSFFDAVLFGEDLDGKEYLHASGEEQWVRKHRMENLNEKEIGILADEIIDVHETDLKVAVNYLQGKPNISGKYCRPSKVLSKDL